VKPHSIRQDYQDFLGLAQQYLVHPIYPVKNEISSAIKFLIRFNWPLFRPATGLKPCMKLHEIQCHFREVPHAVAEYGLRPRRRPRTRPSYPIKF
jgi:hypothetical protein